MRMYENKNIINLQVFYQVETPVLVYTLLKIRI